MPFDSLLGPWTALGSASPIFGFCLDWRTQHPVDGSAQPRTKADEPQRPGVFAAFPRPWVQLPLPSPRGKQLFDSLVGWICMTPKFDQCPGLLQILPGDGPTPSRLVFPGPKTLWLVDFLLSAYQMPNSNSAVHSPYSLQASEKPC